MHDHQAQLHEHYGKEAQTHSDSVVASAIARAAALVSSMQTGIANPAILQQFEQTRQELVGARQEVENLKGTSVYWEDQAMQLAIQSRRSPESYLISEGALELTRLLSLRDAREIPLPRMV